MDIALLVGLKVIGADSQSRRVLKLRFKGGSELLVPSLYVRDAQGQDLDVQKLVGARITSVSFTNNQFQLNATGRDGNALTFRSQASIFDSQGSPVLGNQLTFNSEPLTYLGQPLTYGA